MKKDVLIYPLVSICMPTFNGETYIEEALNSAIHQDYPNLEIVVSDDDSKDLTVSIVESFRSKTTIPIYVYNHEPSSIGANWNYSIKKASGNYVKFLFQDDTLQIDSISKMMAVALQNTNIGLVYCKRHFLVENTSVETNKFISFYGHLESYWDNKELPKPLCSGRLYLKDKALLNSPKNKIGEPTAVLLKKECFDKVGWFNETLKQTLDYEYWYRLMKFYNVAFINEQLVGFRLHDAQASQVNKKNHIGTNETMLLYKQYYEHIYSHLHPNNKLKLLKLYHPLVKRLIKLKQLINA